MSINVKPREKAVFQASRRGYFDFERNEGVNLGVNVWE